MEERTSVARQGGPPVFGYALLIGLALFWGFNWPAMKIIVGEMTVWWFRALSVTVGGVGLLVLAWLTSGTKWPDRSEFMPLVICAIFSILGWHIFTGYGVSLIPAGRASIIAYLMPLFVAVFSVPVLGERMTWHKIAGLLLGIAGLAVLIGPDLIVVQQAPIGALCMVAAAFTWAIGTVLFKKFAWVSPVTAITGWQLLLAALVIVPGALILEPVPDFAGLSQDVWVALLYLFALPMIFCQWAFLMVIRIFPAAVAAIGTLAVPVVGVYSSALVLGEPVGWAEFTALILISAALFVVLVLPALAGRTGRHATRPSA